MTERYFEFINPNIFIEKIQEFDIYLQKITALLDPHRQQSIFQASPKVKWTTQDDNFIYKAMSLSALRRLEVSRDFLNLFNFTCFEDFEIVFSGQYLTVIKQRKLKRIELLDNSDLTLPIVEQEIKQKFSDITFYPFKNLSPYQKRFYLDYPDEFYTLMQLIKEFEIRDAIEFSNCGIDPDTKKIKCFDLELQNAYPMDKIERFIRKYSEFKDYKMPSFAIFIRN